MRSTINNSRLDGSVSLILSMNPGKRVQMAVLGRNCPVNQNGWANQTTYFTNCIMDRLKMGSFKTLVEASSKTLILLGLS